MELTPTGAKPTPALDSASHRQEVQSSPIVPKRAVSILNARLDDLDGPRRERDAERLAPMLPILQA